MRYFLMNPCDKLIEITQADFAFFRKLDNGDMWLEAIESQGVIINITGWDMGKGITRQQKATALLALSKIL